MSVEGQSFETKAEAPPKALLRLARAYRKSAELLFPIAQEKPALSYWPCRLLAIHSVELFLNAYLQSKGLSPDEVRAMQHDLAKRAEHAVQFGLRLKKKTTEHLKDIRLKCEYRVVRYEPERRDKVSQLTQLRATLRDIAGKVESSVRKQPTTVKR